MTLKETKLYERIENYSFDEGAPEGSFASRLSKDNGWPPVYTFRVLTEYQKFVFLMMTSSHMAVPSDAVDQAWHQHILFTVSWVKFCDEVLGEQPHHEPARAGADDGDRFKAAYVQTLATYRRHFGEPPEDIWPGPNVRFGRDLHYQRVNIGTNLVIPRSWLRNAAILIAALAGSVLLSWMS